MKTTLGVILLGFLSLAGAQAPTVPQTLQQAFQALNVLLSPTDRASFIYKLERVATVELHMSLGLYIRNTWLRSGRSRLAGYLHDKGAQSFDDASSMILTSYWRHLNGRPIKLETQGTCFVRWAREQARLEQEAALAHRNSYSMPDFDCP